MTPTLHVILTPTPAAWLDIGKGPRNPRVAVDVSGSASIFFAITPGSAPPPIRVLDAHGVPVGEWHAAEVYDGGTRVYYAPTRYV